MKLYQKISIILVIIILSCQDIHASTCDSTSLQLMEQVWREFRAIHPFGFQTVGLKHCGDTCVFIISEPNNWVKESDLQQLFEKNDGHLIIQYQSYGIDGQLTDAVGCAKLDSLQFLQLEKELFTLLYHTDYKPFYTDLDHPVKHIYFSDSPLDYTYSWEHLNEQKFGARKLQDGVYVAAKMGLLQLCSCFLSCSNDIFYSSQWGIVLWLIDKNIDYISDQSFLVNARRFALDSDLIWGTYENDNIIAIIGRERTVPVTILPPLRSETILSLAVNNEDLSLVFSREGVVKVNDSLFVTPVKMSQFLNDTELGNLMMITDVLLKSWSENGKVTEWLIDYPQPKIYPFTHGVAHELGDSTKYLWNLAATDTDWPGLQLKFTTGSLPPTYWSADDSLVMKQITMNNIAYRYFTRLNNPDLVRVSAYADLYRIFQGCGVKQSYQNDGSWVQTPSRTISNIPWGYGGYSYQKGLGKAFSAVTKLRRIPAKLRSNTRLLSMFKQFPQLSIALNQSNLLRKMAKDERLTHVIATDYNLAKLLAKDKQFAKELGKDQQLAKFIKRYPHLADRVAQNPDMIKDMEIVLPFPRDPIRVRGFSNKEHVQPTSGSQILTESEIEEKVYNSQRNEKKIFEMMLQLQKYNIPLKAIIDEKKHTVCIIFHYDDQKYEYAA